MPRTSAPTGADVSLLYISAGVIPQGPLPAPFSSIDFDVAAAAALTQWEMDSRWHPFVWSGADTTRQFRVTAPERIIDLKGGLLSDPSTVTVTFTPLYGGTPSTPMQHLTQWELQPFDELSNNRPYTMLQIIRLLYGIYSVTGKWGRSLTWPDDAWDAVLRQAVLIISGETSVAVTGGPSKIKLGPVDISYDPDALAILHTTCEARYKRVLTNYRRMSML